MTPTGTLYGISTGCEAELITLKAVRVIQAVDVIAYPKASSTNPIDGETAHLESATSETTHLESATAEINSPEATRLESSTPETNSPEPIEAGEITFKETGGMAFKIAEPHIPKATERLPLALPINKSEATRQRVYKQNAEAIGNLLRQGKDVGFLCEGDCLLYGSFCHLLALLEGKFPIEVVAGVNSFSAAAAHLKQPLATGNEALVIVPATNPQLAELLSIAQRAVVVKPSPKAPPLPKGFKVKQYGSGYFSLRIVHR